MSGMIFGRFRTNHKHITNKSSTCNVSYVTTRTRTFVKHLCGYDDYDNYNLISQFYANIKPLYGTCIEHNKSTSQIKKTD